MIGSRWRVLGCWQKDILLTFFCQFYLCEGGFPFYLDLNVSRLVFHYFFWFARPSSHPLVLCSHIHTAIHVIFFDFVYIYYITVIDFCGNFQCILGEKIGAIRDQKTTKCLASCIKEQQHTTTILFSFRLPGFLGLGKKCRSWGTSQFKIKQILPANFSIYTLLCYATVLFHSPIKLLLKRIK